MSLAADLAHTLRTLRRKPGFTTVAVLTLALGTGANTAIFSLVDAVLLHPLPYRQPESLVSIKDDLRGLNLQDVGMSEPEFEDFRDRSGVFSEISAVWPISANITGAERPERVEALAVSPSYFAMLGAAPQLGRILGPQDLATGFAEAAVLSDGLWRRLYGADPHTLGKQLRLDTDLYTIVGVMPPSFRHPGQTLEGQVEVWITAGFAASPFPVPPIRRVRMLPAAIGRIRPELSIPQAQQKLQTFTASLAAAFPADYAAADRWAPRLTPLQQDITGNLRTTLLVVFAAIACVLLICCVSIANLIVAKVAGQQREIAVRRALGATWGGLARQLITESLAISLLGGAAGWILACIALPFLPRIVPAALPVSAVSVNATVLLFASAISILTGAICGVAPLIPILRTDIVASLRDGSRGSTVGAGHDLLRRALVASEIAVALMLLTGAGLLFHSFWNLLRVAPGFDPHNVLVANIWLPVPNDPAQFKYGKPANRNAFSRELLRRLSALPGVDSAAMATGDSIPLAGLNRLPFRPEDFNGDPGRQPVADAASVSPGFFRTMRIPLSRGRTFNDGDDGRNPVVIVDETLARSIWPGQDVLGKRLSIGQPPRTSTIVGVVGDTRTGGFDKPPSPHMFFPLYQRSNVALSVFLKTASNPKLLGESVRREVRAVDPDLPVFGVRSMEEVAARSLAQRRFQLQMVGSFAAIALFLAALGIYGVTAFWVGQRTQEIGIRLALGAQARDVVRLVLRQGLVLISWGLAAGLVASLPMARLIRALLFNTTPFDPVTFVGIAALLAAAALAACFLPALRATRVDPTTALRSE